MHVSDLHSWDLTPAEAVALQRELAGRVDTSAPLGRLEVVAGADVSCNRFSDVIYAGVVVLKLPGLEVIERQGAVLETHFPYVPGLLTFREGPALLKALARVRSEPDVVVFDGQGIAHPRRLGLASHLGLWLDRPSVGCAKSRLTGTFKELGRKAGSTAFLTDHDQVVGKVVRTRDGVKPVFVSPGHRIDLEGSVEAVLACRKGYRLPEPTRLADQFVNELRRSGAC
ncbi:MAG TPA: deoxyribonuclease V [Gemmataceae bacterium]|nr:deoxyribonuclease V [Gemmataceae bacterium]